MHDLENIHANLEVIESAISALSDETHKEIDVADYSEFCLTVNDILNYDTTAYSSMAAELSISPTILTKFIKFRGKIPTHTALAVASRLRGYVRSLDQRSPHSRSSPVHQPPSEPRPNEKPVAAEAPALPNIPVEQWLFVPPTPMVSAQISTIAMILNTIVVQLKRTNAPPELQAVIDVERAQLVAILETALALLKSPFVEKGLLKKTAEVLFDASKKALAKQVEQGIGNASAEVGKRLLDLLKLLN